LNLSKQSLLDTSPAWLSLTLSSSAGALAITGIGVFFGFTDLSVIDPFTLLLHLVWAIALSAWVLNLRLKLAPDKKALAAIGAAVSVGSVWSSIQQWLAFTATGTVNDILLVVGAMVMDVAGGAAAYFFYRFNIVNKQNLA
jgi:hypothetical protein